MNQKLFTERLNKELVSYGLPIDPQEKARAFARVFKIKPHMAHSMMLGQSMPDDGLLAYMASEFEVNPDWLKGASDKRKS